MVAKRNPVARALQRLEHLRTKRLKNKKKYTRKGRKLR
jgi:hypothetical protein